MAINRNETPSDIAVNRLSEKISWFEGSSSKRSSWATEAKERVEEGDYHPNWASIIEFLEQ